MKCPGESTGIAGYSHSKTAIGFVKPFRRSLAGWIRSIIFKADKICY
jgi:hypothetical protein